MPHDENRADSIVITSGCQYFPPTASIRRIRAGAGGRSTKKVDKFQPVSSCAGREGDPAATSCRAFPGRGILTGVGLPGSAGSRAPSPACGILLPKE